MIKYATYIAEVAQELANQYSNSFTGKQSSQLDLAIQSVVEGEVIDVITNEEDKVVSDLLG